MFLRFEKTNLAELSDDALFRMYQKTKEQKYISVLYQRNIHLFYGACIKYLRDKEESYDAAMVIFEKMITNPPQEKVQSFSKWVYVLLKNECTNRLRDRHRDQHKIEGLKRNEKNPEIFMENGSFFRLNIEGHELNVDDDVFSKAFMRLKKEHQVCLKLFFFEKKTYKAIAQQTGYTLVEVKSYLQNGKRMLRQNLEHIAIYQE